MLALGFTPAFYDFASQRIYPSCFPDGAAAQVHVVDGLPEEAVADRSTSGRVVRLKQTVIAGYLRDGFFYTRAATARAIEQWASPRAARISG